MTRSNSATNTAGDATTAIVVRGIERVGFRARIEITNIFLTGYAFFVIFVMFIVIGVIVFKLVCEALVKGGRLKGDKFQEFRNGWTTVLKGILFRIVLIGFPQMVVLCFWELTVRDSAAEVVLAIFTVITMICMLAWASTKVIRLARRSIAMHKNPAYILYSDPVSLNKWGFLYVQFKATAYYFIVPILGFVLIKGMFIALSQSSGTVQAIALVVLEACLLITVSILRPYMDKKTNGFNIAISASNFLSAIFLLVFTGIFNQPGIVTGVMGVIFFIYNAVFALILLLMVLISTIYALASKNPDTRYQPMRDDRGSFIKSQTMLTTELDALGATARGDSKLDYRNGSANNIHHKTARIEDDDESWSNSSTGLEAQKAAANANFTTAPSMTSYPSDATQRHAPPSFRSNAASPAPSTRGVQAPVRGNANANANAGGGMWQRGAGYER
ncbi:hypothetical protein LTR04_003917 [Oleoguttula sp. CCFEE 6159]|nr:hypothetical protein LTR04_003917 [Oleoguttula sp. CCFEE 6159]